MSLEELWQLFPIELSEHKDFWGDRFCVEAERLRAVLPHDAVIHHIGSTAIAGICAKPIIDILIAVARDEQLLQAATALEQCGYLVMSKSQNRISLNKGYTEHGFAENVFHAHIRLADDTDELYFRDYLNAHPAVAKEYETLKRRLAAMYRHNRDAYTDAKTAFVNKYTALGKAAANAKNK